MLKVQDLHKSFGKQEVVKGVSFKVEAGEIFAFLGPNGAGKTTTIKMGAGLLIPDAGTITIDGLDPHRQRHASTRFGAVLEGNRNLYWRLSPFENLRYFGVHKGMAVKAAASSADQLLERFGLSHKRDALVSTLSRGMQQKLAIAVAMLNAPRLLFLDEPTLGLDAAATVHVVDLVRALAAEGVAVVLTTHQLDIAETLADRVAIIRDGRIIKESRTDRLIMEFELPEYEIHLGAELDEDRARTLAERFGARVEDGMVLLPDGPSLYDALDVIRPVPVNHVGRPKMDLTRIFLQLTGEVAHA